MAADDQRNRLGHDQGVRARSQKETTPNVFGVVAEVRHAGGNGPQRDSIFTKGSSDVLDHATSEMAIGSKLGIDATKRIPCEGFKRPWPPLIRMDESVRKKNDALFAGKL